MTHGAELKSFALPEILNTVSHDMRSAVGILSGAASELDSDAFGALTPEQKQLLGLIRRSGSRLVRLAQNLTTFAELHAGDLALQPTRIDIVPLLQQVINELKQEHRSAAAVKFTHRPVAVVSDAERLRQLFSGIIWLSFGTTRTRFDMTLTSEDLGARLEIADDGPPLTADVASPPRADSRRKVSSYELQLATYQGLAKAIGCELELLHDKHPDGRSAGNRTTLIIPASHLA